MRWCWRALSAASVATVLLVALAMLLFTPGAAIAGQSETVWHPHPGDPAALARMYDVSRSAMQGAGAPYAQWAGQGRQFLAFSSRGNGRIVEVFGDLAAADRIAVLVPGVSTTANNFSTGLDDVRDRAPAVQARALYDATRAANPGQHVAVIAWLGYDAPQGVGRAAAREELARAGASALDGFTRDLAILRPRARVTLIGHSYGSVVTGLAAANLPAQVKDLVVVGSPGMGVSRAADLHTSARVWAGQSAQDWIDWVPAFKVWGAGHGTLPVTAGFGARVFGTTGVIDHDHYLAPGTQSLGNIVEIVLGRDSGVSAPSSPALPGQASG
ncbi:MAG TPA: alpha/beta hydrolase [Dermatophilaceae bacterium]|jgi:Alpha/beta hydrolase